MTRKDLGERKMEHSEFKIGSSRERLSRLSIICAAVPMLVLPVLQEVAHGAGKTGLPDTYSNIVAILMIGIPLAVAPIAHRLM